MVEVSEAVARDLEKRFGPIIQCDSGDLVDWLDVTQAALAAMTAASPPVEERGAELLRMWRDLVIEGGVPRYTVLPGAVLNTLVTWTDAALANQEKANG